VHGSINLNAASFSRKSNPSLPVTYNAKTHALEDNIDVQQKAREATT